MTKTTCDICGKEMPTSKNVETIENMNFAFQVMGQYGIYALDVEKVLIGG